VRNSLTIVDRRTAACNSTYKKLAVQWLNEALCRFGGPIRIKFCGGRQFSASKSPTSCSAKTVDAAIVVLHAFAG